MESWSGLFTKVFYELFNLYLRSGIIYFDETLEKESTWNTVVLIPKGAIGDFRGIGLVKVL